MSEATSMTSHPIVDQLTERFGGSLIRSSTFRDNLRVLVDRSALFEVLSFLKDNAGYTFLSELGGIDYLGYPDRQEGSRFEVHYVLLKQETSDRIIIKVGVDDPDPTLPSVMPLWGGANWMEREVFDMYGIRFDGHPDLRRILMPDEFTSYPLRKDYPLRGRGERHNFPKITRDQS
ncbi:NADH-quinone oxidoreductase subunit C [Tautonia rosea]|uniref:NADH-quinone oxidoreductase subunit C n=1 Tax=Tautonia rosea TaxID=2728037 RepID=UPI0019D31C15|nr:NADH-quinone oxidoreductase subunit C [Tautonia rosea]